MISISFPELESSSEEFYDAVVPTTTPKSKRVRLQAASPAVANAIEEYRRLAAETRLCEVLPTTDDFGDAHKEDFKSLYGSFLLASTAKGKNHYDRLMIAHSQRVCAYCGTRKAKTIDHYLPQSQFPHLSIAFENLVASCFECNTVKSDAAVTQQEQMLFHPYYEAFPHSDWLVANVVRDPPITVEYQVASDADDHRRVSNQFNKLRLGEIFAFNASNELRGWSEYFRKLGQRGPANLRNHLLDSAESASRHAWYPWKPILYQTLADDDWFCEEGYLECD